VVFNHPTTQPPNHPFSPSFGDRRQEALWLLTQGFAESELLFEIGANARRLASEFPEALAWL